MHILKNITRFCSFLLIAFMLGSCSSSGVSRVTNSSLLQASNERWVEQIIPAPQKGGFELFSLRNTAPPIGGVLSVYIEGDGNIWSGEFPSHDPTPRRAMSLDLALHQPHGAAAYLARPCQYLGVLNNPQCKTRTWTHERYSEEVVKTLDHGIDVLKGLVGAQKIVLVGYSGGGALAVLIAGRRNDIVEIITVAGNLDTNEWTDYHQLRPLSGSLNPTDFLVQAQLIRQVHYVGGQDEIVPPFLTQNLAKYYPVSMQFKVIPIQENGHTCCWVEQWPELWNRAISQ
ncbi:alpha/beta hydrolase [Polynucleobacter sp. Ross1-W9]|uniref:alpha/beta fold hydrolase n=1 Tax=Polynucleobacter parvulilacunae TaxID=1855631 RepID=UPI001C0AE68D|nr:alpha/beta hydrolase [Polynucleobacter parvulilacunae]MBU3557626.1 alpha/beta hydrolase [Polynucleobacter parvulilacunae]